jgi:hypothetical protein
LPCYVYLVIADTGKKFTPLLGRDWLDVLRPNWRNIFKVHSIQDHSKENFIQKVHLKYEKLFDNDLKTPIKGQEVSIQLRDDAKPTVSRG